MYSTIFSLAILALHFLLPSYLILKLWIKKFASRREWIIDFSTMAISVLAIFIIGRWDITGFEMRYWACGVYLLTGVGSFVYVPKKSSQERIQGEENFRSARALFDLCICLSCLTWILLGYVPIETRGRIKIDCPLRGNGYYVAQGGRTWATNYHGALSESQQYAIDITQLNKSGFRASGLFPTKLSRYTMYGDTVFSPVEGTVVSSVDSLPDRSPPVAQQSNPSGNHVWVESESGFQVLLAHLKKGSLMVKSGQTVRVGQPLGRVGSTGNSSEPHLHMHAVLRNSLSKTFSRYSNEAIAVPLYLNGRFLRRNDIIYECDA